MSEIPADVMEAALAISYSAEIAVPVGSLPGAIYIARAIMAERERCAKKAIDHALQVNCSNPRDYALGRAILE